MKLLPLIFLSALPLAFLSADVRVGDTIEQVRAELGTPRGEVRTGDREILYFERGRVEIQDQTVVRVALISPAEYAAAEARRIAEAARVREENEILRARLDAEGEAVKARKLADPSFLSAPPAYQVSFWEDFSRRYPGVASAEQLTIARLRFSEQQNKQIENRTQLAQEQRLAELEERLDEVADRAETPIYSPVYQYGYSGYSPYRRRHDHHPFTFWPIKYPDLGLPTTTSPNTPWATPSPQGPSYTPRYDWGDPRKRDRDSDSEDDRSNRGRRGRY